MDGVKIDPMSPFAILEAARVWADAHGGQRATRVYVSQVDAHHMMAHTISINCKPGAFCFSVGLDFYEDPQLQPGETRFERGDL